MRGKHAFRKAGHRSRQGLAAVAQQQQNVAVLGEEVVEPHRCPVPRCEDRRIGRPVTRGRSRLSGGVFLDYRTVPINDREARESLAELFATAGICVSSDIM